jgi:hypothetical protein
MVGLSEHGNKTYEFHRREATISAKQLPALLLRVGEHLK